MENLPSPLVCADCDLRDFTYMPLDVVRLRDSDLASIDAEAFRAAVLSWCVSWHQSPAASLPDDDAALCRLLGYGRDTKGWIKVRAAGALHGYVKCSDGRLYHPVVAEKAMEAWQKKLAQRDRTEAARLAKLAQKAGMSVAEYVASRDQPLSQSQLHSLSRTLSQSRSPPVTSSKGEERRGEEGRGDSKQPALTQSPREAVNGRDHSPPGRMPSLNSPWSAWEWLTDGEAEIDGPNAERRPAAGGHYLDAVAFKVAEAARIDGHGGSVDWRPVVKWLRDGIDPETIVRSIERVANRRDYEPPGSLGYFDRPIREAHGKIAA